jgi:hypothetical protein
MAMRVDQTSFATTVGNICWSQPPLQTTVVVHFENLSFCHLYLENDEKI